MGSRLFQLDENPSAVLRVEKHHWFAVCADLRGLAQRANVLLLNVLHRLVEVIHLD